MALIFPIGSGLASWNSKKEQAWKVTEFKSASGRRKAMIHQEYPNWVFNLTFPQLTNNEVDMLFRFHSKRKGSWESFFYKDYLDYRAIGQSLEKVEGSYQAVVPLTDEPCELIDNVKAYINGMPTEDFTVEGGKIYLEAEGEVKFDYDYYYRVVFEDKIVDELIFDDVHKVSLKLSVVR